MAATADCLVAAAWLHDIGYAPSVRVTGFHPVDGAFFARREGFDELVVSLVAFHSGAPAEAQERGIGGCLPSPNRRNVLSRQRRATFSDRRRHCAGDVGRPGGRQKSDNRGDLLRLASPT
jgi:HD domain